MDCREIMDLVYEYDGDDSAPLFVKVRLWFHAVFCSRCAREMKRYAAARETLHAGFFSSVPDLEESIMARIFAEPDTENCDGYEIMQDEEERLAPMEEGISFRSWVINGLIVFFSLSTSFFSLNFNKLAVSQDLSFLLPMGITIGLVLTVYCAVFIGSHIKELSEKFGLR
jgi:hypothetical protein